MDGFEYPTELIDALTDITLTSGDRDEVAKLVGAIAELSNERLLAEVLTALGLVLSGVLGRLEGSANKALLPFVVITIAERYAGDGDDE